MQKESCQTVPWMPRTDWLTVLFLSCFAILSTLYGRWSMSVQRNIGWPVSFPFCFFCHKVHLTHPCHSAFSSCVTSFFFSCSLYIHHMSICSTFARVCVCVFLRVSDHVQISWRATLNSEWVSFFYFFVHFRFICQIDDVAKWIFSDLKRCAGRMAYIQNDAFSSKSCKAACLLWEGETWGLLTVLKEGGKKIPVLCLRSGIFREDIRLIRFTDI